MGHTRKNMKRILWTLLVLGGVLAAVAGVMLDQGLLLTVGLVAGWLALMIVAFVVTEMLWIRKVSKGADALLPLLHTDPDQYIAQLNELLEGVENPNLLQSRDVNLAAAYCQKGSYRTAAEILEKLDPKNLPPAQRGIYWADLALAQFHLNRKKAACAILEEQQQALAPLWNAPKTGALLAVLGVYRMLAQGQQDQARTALDDLRRLWPTDNLRHELTHLEQQCRG